MSLWKVKFNHKDGETRKCKVCEENFHTMKPIWRCRTCTSKYIFERQKEKYGEGMIIAGKFAGRPLKKPYPFNTRTFENRKRFDRIKRELNECKTKEERRAHYAKQLDEIMHNGIWEWILDRRDDETSKQTKSKSKNRTTTDYPDLRGWYEE